MSVISSRYLTFKIGKHLYGIPLLTLKLVSEVPPCTKIANTPNYYLGISKIQGNSIGILDLRHRFSIDPEGPEYRKTNLVFQTNTGLLGLIVDDLRNIISINDSNIEKNIHIKSKIPLDYLVGIFKEKDSYIHLIDLNKIFSEDEIKIFSKSESIL